MNAAEGYLFARLFASSRRYFGVNFRACSRAPGRVSTKIKGTTKRTALSLSRFSAKKFVTRALSIEFRRNSISRPVERAVSRLERRIFTNGFIVRSGSIDLRERAAAASTDQRPGPVCKHKGSPRRDEVAVYGGGAEFPRPFVRGVLPGQARRMRELSFDL